MNSKDWEIIYTISKEGNLSRASKKIYLSQPAITKRIQKIERELGINILYKTNKGAQLTPQGEYLANKASALIKKFKDVENSVQRIKKPLSGTIKISAANFMMQYKLPELLSKFKELHPDIEFEVVTGSSGEMIKKIQNQTSDLSFIRGDYPWPDGKLLLFEEPLCIASKQFINPDILPKLNRIDYHTDYKLKELIDNWWMQNYNTEPTSEMVVSRTDVAIEMVASGLGYTIVPKLVVKKHPDLYTVDLKNNDNQTIIRPSWMFYTSNSKKIEVINTFINFIKNYEF